MLLSSRADVPRASSALREQGRVRAGARRVQEGHEARAQYEVPASFAEQRGHRLAGSAMGTDSHLPVDIENGPAVQRVVADGDGRIPGRDVRVQLVGGLLAPRTTSPARPVAGMDARAAMALLHRQADEIWQARRHLPGEELAQPRTAPDHNAPGLSVVVVTALGLV